MSRERHIEQRCKTTAGTVDTAPLKIAGRTKSHFKHEHLNYYSYISVSGGEELIGKSLHMGLTAMKSFWLRVLALCWMKIMRLVEVFLCLFIITL